MATIFRKKSLERIQSPDQLDEYIHVANPAVWMVLAAIVLLLVGGGIWASVGTIEETVPAALVVRGGEATCYVAQGRSSEVSPGDAVRVEAGTFAVDSLGDAATSGDVSASGSSQLTVVRLDETPVAASEVVALAGDAATAALGDDAWAATVQVDSNLPDGVYTAAVVTDSYHPLALLFGGN